MSASTAAISSNWPSFNGANGDNDTTSSYSSTNATNAASSAVPRSASIATAASPSAGAGDRDIGNTLHSTLSGLSLNGTTSNGAKSPSASDYTRPLPMRTPSAGSLGHQQQLQPTVQISAIGSGRSGTSPPSRANNTIHEATLNGSTSIGSPNSVNAMSPSSGSMLQQLPQSQQQQQQARHTPSHSLPWPSYTNPGYQSPNSNNLQFGMASGSSSSSNNSAQYHRNNSLDGGEPAQSNNYTYNTQQNSGFAHLSSSDTRQRQHTLSDNSGGGLSSSRDDLPDLSSSHHSSSDFIDGSNHQDDASTNTNGRTNSTSESRFSLSQQPQFNLDHAQLAKSREQRDLDDVDSGQRASATLWMGDLEGWMDETYIKRCITALGWDRDENGNQSVSTSVKMIKGASSTSGYCFITFPTAPHAQSVLGHFSKQPPMLMPGSERTFKLNWATGLPGVQPKWEGEYSIFVGDLGREVTEGELVALFTPLFQSTKSAKIMYDPSTGLSRGYGFVRFGDENDMNRSLSLGQNTSGSGLSLRGRTLRISEASGSGGSRNRTSSGNNELDNVAENGNVVNGSNGNGHASIPVQGKNGRELNIKVPVNNMGSAANLLGPNATGFSIPVLSPTSPNLSSSPYQTSPSNHSGPSSGQVTPLSPSADPTNTTVFVGGLPACISEETLRSFFQHFGDIAYVKIPPNKGCGFVQFVRRPDAELAIAKMHDFPIHGKSRIRLSWGRSQGDKQVEHVRKLANALNVPFEAVWRMVQGQDNSTIKQIASAVGGNNHITRNGGGGNAGAGPGGLGGPRGGPGNTSPTEADSTRAGLARLANLRQSVGPGGGPSMPPGPFGESPLSRSAIFDSMQGGVPPQQPQQGMNSSIGPGFQGPPGGAQGQGQGQGYGPHDSEAYAFRPAVPSALSPAEFGFAGPPRAGGDSAGPYSRVSPSAFAPLSTSNLSGQAAQSVPLTSPPVSGGRANGMYGQHRNHHQHQHPQHYNGHQQPMPGYGGNFDPYTPVSIPSPVGNHNGHASAAGVLDGPHSALDASSNFGSRTWRQHAGSEAELSAPSPSFQGALPDFLSNNMNGRF